MAWLQFSVEVPGDLADSLSEVFHSMGALSITVLDAGDEPLLEPAPGDTPLWSRSRLVALFDDGVDPAVIERQLKIILPEPSPDIVVESLDEKRKYIGQATFLLSYRNSHDI